MLYSNSLKAAAEPPLSILNKLAKCTMTQRITRSKGPRENGFADNEDRLPRTDISWFLEVGQWCIAPFGQLIFHFS
ncbi:hypothetical protein U1Q18_018969 [Sarracenia purpurea var. burkii]